MAKDVVMCSRFNKKFKEIYNRKSGNNVYLSKEKYTQIINEVKVSKVKVRGKNPTEYRRQKRFDVLKVGSQEKLICPLSAVSGNIRYFVCNDDLFKVIHEVHLSIGHAGRNKMMKELKSKYINVTSEAVMIYLNLCKPCRKKSKTAKEEIVVKPVIFSELDSRCQIDWIDMQARQDGDFRYILVYQDHLTKFVFLRPLKGKSAEEVAHVLVDVFAIIGAPNVLQCESDREYANRLVQLLCSTWDELKMVHGKPSVGSLERAKQDIEIMLTNWLQSGKNRRWSFGLRYVQMMKNRAYHEDIEGSPFEALFGREAKIGLRSSSLPSEAIANLHSEEELQKAIDLLDLEGLEPRPTEARNDEEVGGVDKQYETEYWDGNNSV